ncbi:bile acid:sodium symporter [Microbacterium limosum]|uniref:Bile acid:sodium symporter n=1 Tax=Microbacterium limosum TaxID=3079935 RepID=A0AAU0MHD3_9MICO|nr:bile acid:sodium symporter [Microbacterium sp. Y20]WOQ69227.1 bile acid:sodium symporter [Microbacterium sp. Y20]
MRAVIGWAERHQVPLYLAALAAGVAFGHAVPAASRPLELAITPILGLLLYATFLGVPFSAIGSAVRDGRFLVTVLLLNFVAVPAVVFALSRFVAGERAVLVGVLLVLLTPCVDYVIVFTGLAGGSRARLLAATPLLMLAQMALLPAYLWLMVGGSFVAELDLRPFVDAFLLLIVLPLAAAVATQLLAARAAWARRVDAAATGLMVPLMMATLAVVVASQVPGVAGRWTVLAGLLPLYVAFAAVMIALGRGAGSLARLDAPGRRAVVFSGVTRNSLVVLPLALALPSAYALTPLVVVTQTLVELLVMVAMVAYARRAMPRA